MKSYTITPEAFGFPRCAREDLRGGTPAENAAITRAILQGEQGAPAQCRPPQRWGSALPGGQQTPCRKGGALAAHCIDTGKAMETLERFLAGSNREGVGA